MHSQELVDARKDKLERLVSRSNFGIISRFWSDKKTYERAKKVVDKDWTYDDDPIDRLQAKLEEYVFVGAN